ncbi:MAG: UDP-N-acetylmuramoyl-L-alanine--D-glutamate ligase [Pseudomonadales bacterium]
MTKRIANIVVGLGKTGFSCVRYLAAQGADFMVVDTRQQPPYLAQLKQQFPDVTVQLGELDAAVLSDAERLIMSPGLALDQPAIQQAVASGTHIGSDIDLFCEAVNAPIVAITGSNAKSTVTTLVGLMAEKAGKSVGVGGNLGTPVLELLADGEQDLYVLELSSFQLELTELLTAEVATILNISPDHMDRYADFEAYQDAKRRVFNGCRQIIVNQDEDLLPAPEGNAKLWHYSITDKAQSANDLGLAEYDDQSWLMQGEQRLMPVDDVKIKGLHNSSNALAALALGLAVDLPMDAMLQTLREFSGLAHRCQWITQKDGVDFYNDSKGTNVGATVAALNGLGPLHQKGIVLIAGGDGKGADFDDLHQPVWDFCSHLVLLGKDAQRLQDALSEEVPVSRVSSMEEAVQVAAQQAKADDAVLLSPACASLDMFANFEARGDAFVNAAEAL